MPYFSTRLQVPVPVEDLFAWHQRPGAFARLCPPWEPVHILDQSGLIQDGDWLRLRMGPSQWLARHRAYLPNRHFADLQAQGPLAFWYHRHRFKALSDHESLLEDSIEYQLPFSTLLNPVAPLWEPLLQQKLSRMFAYRHRILQQDLGSHARYTQGKPPMKILITGASGLLGQNLQAFLSTGGHTVYTLSRRAGQSPRALQWDPASGQLDAAELEGLDAVIHLAGESVAGGLWTPTQRARIRDSRVQGTRLLVQTLSQLARPPRVLISASAIGYYGPQPPHSPALSESAPAGKGFLAEVCQAWEAETRALENIRVVNARIGVVLSRQGGALKTMLPAFQLGLGSVLGNGQQIMSWIVLDDVIQALYHCLYTDSLSGPVNLVAPQPVSNRDFTRSLNRVLQRPGFLPVPATALKLALGDMAEEMLLGSIAVQPQQLLNSGFVFHYSSLEPALRHLLGR